MKSLIQQNGVSTEVDESIWLLLHIYCTDAVFV